MGSQRQRLSIYWRKCNLQAYWKGCDQRQMTNCATSEFLPFQNRMCQNKSLWFKHNTPSDIRLKGPFYTLGVVPCPLAGHTSAVYFTIEPHGRHSRRPVCMVIISKEQQGEIITLIACCFFLLAGEAGEALWGIIDAFLGLETERHLWKIHTGSKLKRTCQRAGKMPSLIWWISN